MRAAKGAETPSPNGTRVGSPILYVDDGIHTTRRAISASLPHWPIRYRLSWSFLSNWVSPTSPATPGGVAVSEAQATGRAQGVKEAGESEGRSVMGWIGVKGC